MNRVKSQRRKDNEPNLILEQFVAFDIRLLPIEPPNDPDTAILSAVEKAPGDERVKGVVYVTIDVADFRDALQNLENQRIAVDRIDRESSLPVSETNTFSPDAFAGIGLRHGRWLS